MQEISLSITVICVEWEENANSFKYNVNKRRPWRDSQLDYKKKVVCRIEKWYKINRRHV